MQVNAIRFAGAAMVGVQKNGLLRGRCSVWTSVWKVAVEGPNQCAARSIWPQAIGSVTAAGIGPREATVAGSLVFEGTP